MKLKVKKSSKIKDMKNYYQNMLMTFSLEDHQQLILSASLASFLSTKNMIDVSTFKSFFVLNSQSLIDDLLNSQKISSTIIELLENKFCKLSFNKLKQIGYLIELPELNKLQDELKYSKSLLKKQESFLYQMSHELKTPLSAIGSYLELLKTRDLDQISNDYIDYIEKAYDQGLYQMNSILELSKLNHQTPVIHEDDIDLKLLFEDLHHIFKASLDAKNLSFHIIFHHIPMFVSDLGFLKQILTNMISNSIKFTKSGSISIETSMTSDIQNQSIEIKITDTGIGMTEEEQVGLFDAFSQANEDISKTYGGTGLGLSIAYKLISLLEGHIKVDSQYQVGTTFTMSLPFKKQNNASLLDKCRKTYSNPKSGLSILVAEDNILSLNATSDLLLNIGLKVVTAKNGKEVLTKFLEYPFDLILMDIQMPLMDGFEATKAIRETDKCIPIIALTANTYQDHYKKCIDSTMNDVLYKPFKAKQLYEMIYQYTKTN